MKEKEDFLNEYAGNKLKAYRENANLTQQQLADKLGVKQQNIARYELGQRTFKMNIVIMLANLFDKQVSDFFPPERLGKEEKEVEDIKKLRKYTGEIIRQKRIARNMTQDDLAELLGVSYQAISRYEKGDRGVNQILLMKLAEIFKCSFDDFFPMEERNFDPCDLEEKTEENKKDKELSKLIKSLNDKEKDILINVVKWLKDNSSK